VWQIGKSPGGRADPAGQGRGRKAHALTGEDFGRAVKWQAIVVLLDEDLRQQARTGATADDRVIRRADLVDELRVTMRPHEAAARSPKTG
jgi:hypothetical protein